MKGWNYKIGAYSRYYYKYIDWGVDKLKIEIYTNERLQEEGGRWVCYIFKNDRCEEIPPISDIIENTFPICHTPESAAEAFEKIWERINKLLVFI